MDGFDKYIGRVFDKRYKIEKIIGVGGMAIVFKAEDILMNRTVAIKMLKDDISGDQDSVKRFINESKAVAMLSHKNIVNIYDVSVKGDMKYIVMEYIEGINLKTFLKHKGGILSWRETLNITEQILRALEHAHSKGIVHRDIKPQNIMLLKNGLIKVADFGIAKLPNNDTFTKTDKAIGTVHYISPEQASGNPINEQSDLYSVGVLMYELATGELPFTAESPVSVAMKQVNEEPKRPRELKADIPEGLEQIILRAMEKDPEKRYDTAKRMLRHVGALKENPGIRFRPAAEAAAITKEKQKKQKKVKKDKPEKERKTVREKGSLVMPIILGVLSAFLIIVVIFALLIYQNIANQMTQKGQDVVVGNYVGEKYDEVLKNQLEDMGFTVTVKPGTAAGASMNEIVLQNPEAGKVLRYIKGETKMAITLYVYNGTDTVSLPDFSYMKYNAVRTEYSGMFRFEEVNETNANVPADYIIRTEPEAGSDVAFGDTITVYVSKGAAVSKVQMPNVCDVAGTVARALLLEQGLYVGNITYIASDLPRNTVISQSVAPNTEIAVQSYIDLVLSEGPMIETGEDTTDETGTDTGSDTGDDTSQDVTDDSSVDTSEPDESSAESTEPESGGGEDTSSEPSSDEGGEEAP